MHNLPDDSAIRNSVSPAVWTGYKSPAICPPLGMVDFISQYLQQGYHIPKEESDKMSHTFWTGSVHDFCTNYLDRDLTDVDHAKILSTANEFVKNRTIIRIDENETDIVKLLASKVVLNAHQWANHAMSYACFLNEQGRLPKEDVFMLQKGTSPIFYENNDFQKADSLKKSVSGVPEEQMLKSFKNWLGCYGQNYDFYQLNSLIADMRYINALIMKKAARGYLAKQRHPHHRVRSVGRSWRGREE